jgi:tetratricopeptide (TPR) repeat protein
MQDQLKLSYQQALQFYNQQDYKKSFVKLIEISNQCSQDSDYLFLLSEVLKQRSDFVGREKALEVLCKVSARIEFQILYMQQLMQNKSVNKALDIGLQLIHLNKQDLIVSQKSVVYDILSQIYIQENDFEGLAEIVSDYEAADIQTEQYYYSQSLLSLHNLNESQALGHLREAVVKNQNFDQAWVALALLHEKMGDSDLSMANLEKALDSNPMNASALKHYAKKSIQMGCVDKAVDKVDFYLQAHNFDHEMTIQFANLMKTKNQNDIVQRESDKLSYYFGHQITL